MIDASMRQKLLRPRNVWPQRLRDRYRYRMPL
jgi:hypothetical protein